MRRANKNFSSYVISLASLGFWLFLASAQTAQASALSDLAASMAPGTWAQLTTNNIAVLNQSGTDGNIIPYGADAAWDPNSRKLLYVGNDHIDSLTSQANRFVIYNADTNTWQNMTPPPWSAPGVTDHGYYHHGINQATGIMYRRAGKSSAVYQMYNITNNTWTASPTHSLISVSSACCAGTDYFPELGGLVLAQGGDVGGGKVLLFKDSTQQWSVIAQNLSPMTGGTFTLGVYNPVHKVMVFGQSGAFYKLDSTGNVTRLANSPLSFYDGGGYLGNLTVDPVSGKYIFLTATGRQLYTYDVAADTWQSQGSVNMPNLSNNSVISTPVSNYGVIMFVACQAVNCRVYLYKYSNSTTPPSPALPTVLLSANPSSITSGASSTLTWSSTNASSCVASGNWTGTKTTSGSQSTGSLSATATFTLTCTGTGGSATQSATVTASTAPPPAGSGGADFQARCATPGVLKCVAFDSQADITGTYGDNHGILPGAATPTLDSTLKASGNSSIKFTIPSNSGANSSGSYFTNFSDNLSTQFGPNSEFYIQWRQRFSTEFLSTNYQGGGGWKQTIIGTGDKPGCNSTSNTTGSGLCYSSCSTLETVTQNTYHRGFAQMYNSCAGSASHGAYNPFEQPFGAYDFKLQNGRSAPYCLYSQSGSNKFPPTGNCFGYFPNEWMTFQVHIKTGPRVSDEFTNSFVQLWIAREGQASELVFDWGPYNLSAGSASEDQRYGKIWLLPYNTGKSSSQSHPTAYTWYDDLIISTTKIPDPSTTTPPSGQPPAAPTSLTLQ